MGIVIKCQHLDSGCSLTERVGKGDEELHSKGNVGGWLLQFIPIAYDDGHCCLSWSVYNHPLSLSLSDLKVIL
jgi:hypothetical protein